MSKNAQLDDSKDSLEKSEGYLADNVKHLHEMMDELGLTHSQKMDLDSLVKSVQHYTYRVALNKQSVQLAQVLQSIYLGCSDPTGSEHYWQYKMKEETKLPA